jgi:hypothetical protein
MITTMCWIGMVVEVVVETGVVVAGALLLALQPATQATTAHAHAPATTFCILSYIAGALLGGRKRTCRAEEPSFALRIRRFHFTLAPERLLNLRRGISVSDLSIPKYWM